MKETEPKKDSGKVTHKHPPPNSTPSAKKLKSSSDGVGMIGDLLEEDFESCIKGEQDRLSKEAETLRKTNRDMTTEKEKLKKARADAEERARYGERVIGLKQQIAELEESLKSAEAARITALEFNTKAADNLWRLPWTPSRML